MLGFTLPKWEIIKSLNEKPAESSPESPAEPVKVEGPMVTIHFLGVSGVGPPIKRIPYRKGENLGQLLRRARVLGKAIRNAIYDKKHPEKGRCRTSYIVQEDSEIWIMAAGLGLQSSLQRSFGDPSPKQKSGTVVDVDLRYKPGDKK